MKKTEDSTSEGREEEVETFSPCLDPDSQHTGAILGMLIGERLVLMMGVLDSVTPKV